MKTFLVVAILTCVLLTSYVTAQTRYDVTDLGTLGGSRSYAAAINPAGDVVGSSTIPGDANWHAFLWTATGGMQDLGTLGGDVYATAINSSQQVAGYLVAPNDHWNAFFWSASTGLVDMGTISGSSNNSWAFGINSAGEVTGTSAAADDHGHTFIWTTTDGFQDAGIKRDSTGYAIDDLGRRIVGAASYGSATVGFAWTKTKGTQLVFGASYLMSLDDQGAATGWVELEGPYLTHAVLWSERSGVTDIGTLTNTSSDSSAGNGISINGQVVGYSTVNGYCGCVGFVYSKATGMQDLNTLVNGNLFIGSAIAINSAGQIAANGSHALLLTPH